MRIGGSQQNVTIRERCAEWLNECARLVVVMSLFLVVPRLLLVCNQLGRLRNLHFHRGDLKPALH